MGIFVRVHLIAGVDREKAMLTCAKLVETLSNAGVVPATFYDTANSKREALTKPVKVDNSTKFIAWLTDRFRARKNFSKTIWAESDGDEFQFGISENRRKFRGAFFIKMDVPMSKMALVEKMICDFTKSSSTELVTGIFVSHPPLEFKAMIDADGSVLIDAEAKETYNRKVVLT